jgi:hypothetical protein
LCSSLRREILARCRAIWIVAWIHDARMRRERHGPDPASAWLAALGSSAPRKSEEHSGQTLIAMPFPTHPVISFTRDLVTILGTKRFSIRWQGVYPQPAMLQATRPASSNSHTETNCGSLFPSPY